MSQMLEDPFVHHHRLLPVEMHEALQRDCAVPARQAWRAAVAHDRDAALPARAYGVWLLATLCSGGLMAALLKAFENLA